MNWGKAIPLVFVVFAGFIGTLVVRMSREHIDLVRDDYYQTELTFQQHIDRVRNARRNTPAYSPQRTLAMTYQPDSQQVVFVLPDSLRRGQIAFYRPADRRADFQVTIPVQHPARQVVSTKTLPKGYWRVQFTWSDGQREYYAEEPLFL
jgi:hypothetical protein